LRLLTQAQVIAPPHLQQQVSVAVLLVPVLAPPQAPT
jgi:hypothetical protein